MSKLANQWIELFRAGKYPQGEFTAADLDQVISNYNSANPDFEEAPSTIGHPAGDAPAWSWWEGLKREGNVLFGKMKDVQPAFEEMVEKRMFPKRSVGLVKRSTGWNLHHVAWLGAKAPAVKGLADCKFESVSDLVEVEFQESAMSQEVNEQSVVDKIWARFTEAFTGKKTETGTSATFTEAQVKEFAASAVKEATKPLQEKLDQIDAKFAESSRNAASVDATTRAANAIAKLKADGKWIPAFDVLGVPSLFEELAKTTETVEFGEAKDGKREKKAPLDILVAFMDANKRIVPDSPVYQGQSARTGSVEAKGVNRGIAIVDDNSVRLHEAAVKFSEENKVTYVDALNSVLRKNPELGTAGGATTGQV